MFLQRPRRRAPNYLAFANDLGSKYAASGAENRPGFDARFIADSHLAPYNRIVFHHNSSGEAGLRSDDDVSPDSAVVTDVNQVVDFDAIPDLRHTESRAIDTRIGADLDIISNFDTSDLRKFFIAIPIADEPEAIGANHASGMKNRTIADRDVCVDCDVWMQEAVRAQTHTRSDGTAASDLRAFADARVRTDNSAGTDSYRVRYFGTGLDYGAGMNARSKRSRRVQHRDDRCKRCPCPQRESESGPRESLA